MWILPNNHPLYSAFAQEYVDSKEDLKEYFDQSELPLMWKSKPLSWKTFCLQWKRVWWMQHLCGRILKPSTRDRFETALMESLEVIHASLSASQETGPAWKIQDTFGRIYQRLLKKSGRSGAFSKTSAGTSVWDIPKFTEAFEIWVTWSRATSTQRQKLALRIGEKDYSFLPLWKTPVASEGEGGIMEVRSGTNARVKLRDQSVHWSTPMAADYGGSTREDFAPKLSEQAKNWGTPRVSTNGMIGTNPENAASRIEDQVLNWPTATARDWKSGKNNPQGTNHRPLNETVLNWPTPISSRGDYQNQKDGTRAPKLSGSVLNWPTPTTMDKMDPKTEKAIVREMTEVRPGRKTFSNLRDAIVRGTVIDFQQDKENSSTNGKSPARLNPAWSIQLMGTTLQKIFTVPLAIQLLNNKPNSQRET